MGTECVDVVHPFDGEVVARVSVPTAGQVEDAVQLALAAAEELRSLPAYVRADALAAVADLLTSNADEIAATITAETGKPIRFARVETGRGIANFRAAAEETKRFSGEAIRLDTDVVGEGRMAFVRRFPIGPILGIAPSNFPLNLAAHKIAPALAVGAPIILKPAPNAPLTALRLAEFIAEGPLPSGALSVLPLPLGDTLDALVRDPRLPVLSYTGSQVGWEIKAAVPRKHVVLELGGNAAAIVHHDADVPNAAERIVAGGFIQAGQTCISTQRVIVHEDVYEQFVETLVQRVTALKTGDPRDPETFVGPLISEAAARKVEAWISEAVDGGAHLHCGGKRDGTTVSPAVLSAVDTESSLWSEEVFGPVICLATYRDIDKAFALVNDSRYGLQAGILTSDLKLAFRAHSELQVGAVIVGDSPSFRADPAPYGGWKESGFGREGVRFAMSEFTAPRVMVLTGVAL